MLRLRMYFRSCVELQFWRDPSGERHDFVVEQRHPHLGRCGHAHLVRVRKVEGGQKVFRSMYRSWLSQFDPVPASRTAVATKDVPGRCPQLRTRPLQLLRPVIGAIHEIPLDRCCVDSTHELH